ncbi:MAG TPA: hypothetical protein P5077_12910 [bacterium]|nr:hypothetical protein [bacterium]
MQAILMARISTREQEQGLSIDAQLRRLNDYADRQKLWSLWKEKSVS